VERVGGLTALERKSRWAWVRGLEGLEAGDGVGEVAALSVAGVEGVIGEGAAAAEVERSRGDAWRARVRMVWENRGVRKSYIGRLHRTSRTAGLVVIGAIVAI
jgi:hypothetical protein